MKFKPNLKYLYILIFIALITVLARLIGLNRGLWADELITINTLNNNFFKNPFYYGFTTNLPLYFASFKIWSLLGIQHVIFYRFFSLLISIAAVCVSYLFLKKEFGVKVVVPFLALLIFVPLQIHYSQEIRPYAMAQLFLILQSIYLYNFLKYKDTRYLNIYTLVTVGSFLTHFAAYFWWFAQLLSLLLLALVYKKQLKALVTKKVITNFVVLVVVGIALYFVEINNPNYKNSLEGVGITNKISNGLNASLIKDYIIEGTVKIKEVVSFYYYYGLYYYQVSPSIQFIFKKVTLLIFVLAIVTNYLNVVVKKNFQALQLSTFVTINTLIIALVVTYTLDFVGKYPFGGRHIMIYSFSLYFVIAYLFSKLKGIWFNISLALLIITMIGLGFFHQYCITYGVNPDSTIPHAERYKICAEKIYNVKESTY